MAAAGALFDEIVLDHVDHIATASAQHGLDRVQRGAQHLGRLYIRRHHQFEAVGGDVKQRRTRVRQPCLDLGLELRRRFDAAAIDADRLRDRGEVRVFQFGVGVQQAFDLLFQFDEAQRAVVVDGYLDGDVLLPP